MCSSQRPLNGADSPCATCNGHGSIMGGDQYRSCPACHGQVECGQCGLLVLTADTELLDAGSYRWRRCFPCRDATDARWAELNHADREHERGRESLV